MNATRVGVATALWTAALVMLVVASVADGQRILFAWAIVCGLVAHAVTMWVIVIHERMRVETITRLAVTAAREHGGLRNVGLDN